MAWSFVLLLAVGVPINYAFDPFFPNLANLYPCNETELDVLVVNYAELMACTEGRAQDAGVCLAEYGLIEGGDLCACLMCGDVFATALTAYNKLIVSGQCPVELFNMTQGGIVQVLLQRPCLFKHLAKQGVPDLEAYCDDPNSFMCGVPSAVTEAAMPLSGMTLQGKCRAALTSGCSENALWRSPSTQFRPLCECAENGVCDSNSTGIPPYQPLFLSLFDLACDSTSLYADSILTALPGVDPQFTVNLSKADGESFELLPQYRSQRYNAPPEQVMGFNQGMYDVIECLPGLVCYTTYVAACFGGSFCPPGVRDALDCPPGSFCPKGSTFPRSCGFLDNCDWDDGYPPRVRIQMMPVLCAGIVVMLFFLLHGSFQVWLCCSRSPPVPGLPSNRATPIPSIPSTGTSRTSGLSGFTSGEKTAKSETSELAEPLLSPIHDSEIDADANADPSATTVVPCGECGEGGARVECHDCGLFMCTDCNLSIHSKGKRTTHRRSPMPPNPVSASRAITRRVALSAPERRSPQGEVWKSDGGLTGLSFHNLTVTVPVPGHSRRPILHAASGQLLVGQVTAVMGPSGASKSTLVDALLGRIKPTEDSKLEVMGASRRELHGRLAHVPQQDILYDTLTVREILTHSAWLRLANVSAQTVRTEVEDLASQLGLTACLDTVVGNSTARGISGGQRKRVSIGVELIARPRLLALDEPTTGLSSTQSLELVTILSQVAARGTIVVAVIHQPRFEVFCQFHSVLLLSRGHVCYQGPGTAALAYFDSLGYPSPAITCNPAEFLLDVLGGHTQMAEAVNQADGRTQVDGQDNRLQNRRQLTPAEFGAWWKTHEATKGQGGETHTEVENGEREQTAHQSVGWWRQCASHYSLYHRLQFRSPSTLATATFINLFSGVLLGVGFLQANGIFLPPIPSDIAALCPASVRTQCLTEPIDWSSLRLASFFLSLAIGQSSLVAAVWVFGEELSVQYRQTSSGASQTAYFVAKCVADVPFIVAGAVVFSAAFLPMLRPNCSWLGLVILFSSVSFASSGLGYLLSMLMSTANAIVSGVVVVFSLCICSGIAPKLREVQEQLGPLRIIWDISYPRYAVEAFVLLESDMFRRPGHAFDHATQLFFDEYGFNKDNLGVDIAAIVVIGLAFRGLALLALRMRHRPLTANKR